MSGRLLAFALLSGVLLMGSCGGDGEPPRPTATPGRTTTSSPSPVTTATVTASPPAAATATLVAETPLASGEAQVVRRGNTAVRAVALTFDAGADTGFTAQILDTLAANGIKATFGITGRWAEQNPELLRRIVREGHVLINHSYDHPSFTGLSTGRAPLSQAQRWEQLDRAEDAVQRIAGVSTKPYFRSPYGDYDASVNADIYARGYRYNVLWTVDSLGWNGLPAAAIVERCLGGAEPGAIYLFHVGAAALQPIIDGLRSMGYGFATVAEVVAA